MSTLTEARDTLVGLRHSKGLTQAQVARRAGMSQPNVARLERQADAPTWQQLSRYARALGRELRISVAPTQHHVVVDLQGMWRDMDEPVRLGAAMPRELSLGSGDGSVSRLAISGAVGVGKTWALAAMVNQVHRHAHVILVDPCREVFRQLQKWQSGAVFDLATMPHDSESVYLGGMDTYSDISNALGNAVPESWGHDGKPVLLFVDRINHGEDLGVFLDHLPELVDSVVWTDIARPWETTDPGEYPTFYLPARRRDSGQSRVVDLVPARDSGLSQLRVWASEDATPGPAWLPWVSHRRDFSTAVQALEESGSREVTVVSPSCSAAGPVTDVELEGVIEALISAVPESCHYPTPERDDLRNHLEKAARRAKKRPGRPLDEFYNALNASKNRAPYLQEATHAALGLLGGDETYYVTRRGQNVYHSNLLLAKLATSTHNDRTVAIYDPYHHLNERLLSALLRTGRSRGLRVVLCSPPTEPIQDLVTPIAEL